MIPIYLYLSSNVLEYDERYASPTPFILSVSIASLPCVKISSIKFGYACKMLSAILSLEVQSIRISFFCSNDNVDMSKLLIEGTDNILYVPPYLLSYDISSISIS